ncbi:ATP-binding protein [Anabaena cylindrica FACHB-243]|uniref:AAA ATPase central domain protein n=1 Tax=Anabaena cylindrica (strain ATCC 27899 / PCC 7122) TaxID=272123 RepID=K9ZI62_ANACC|nr:MULTISPECIES: ATP-binding protein [Anabaena]AFZ58227.1 AAA ATPase central domain protein [Anabaena cylindrica PCC 7122]MBD2419875.1 ATP-binding protein [Anabaena cylindrica FACHB-243]MBY5281001.1 ATP-binding protein [Anabaena sp. CCAP 1446/1C]MBY5307348.1 ATP-binding protein [Anabaena sp. CCAP 1446/1C]MCM2407924.1 ATP-binding protein [Anabaena sp. CCAP 1446/1C]
MARGETLRKLFRSFSRNEREEFLAAAMELIEEEKNKNHILLARDLEKLLHNGNGYTKPLAANITPWNQFPEPPKDKDTGLALLEVKKFDLTWDHIVLSEKIFDILQEIVLENRKQDILAAYNLKPKNKLLFCGPPGCGKTQTAKILSSALGLPLVYVNLTAVFSSYLGETATNLQKIFTYIEKGEWLVLFDEFDAIARDRDNLNEHGEVKRLVNSLLQLIDNATNQSIFVAATNHEKLLDSAVWRRFDEVIFFDNPTVELRTALLSRYLSGIRYTAIDLSVFATRLENATGADIERICSDAIKSVILRSERTLTADDLDVAIGRFLERQSIIANSK